MIQYANRYKQILPDGKIQFFTGNWYDSRVITDTVASDLPSDIIRDRVLTRNTDLMKTWGINS